MRFFPQRQPTPSAKPSVPPPAAAPAPAPAPEPVYEEEVYETAAEAEYEGAYEDPEPVAPVAVAPAPPAPVAPAARFAAPAPVAPPPKPVFTQPKPQPIAPAVMPENPNKNILSKDVEIKGNIRFTNELIIDGKIEGEIHSDGVLTVGENADIRGEVKTKSVTVLGKVVGNITVSERAELKARAHLVGDLKAARLVIEEGATFVGKSEVTTQKAAAANAAGAGKGGSGSSSTPAVKDEGSRGTTTSATTPAATDEDAGTNGGSGSSRGGEKLATFGR